MPALLTRMSMRPERLSPRRDGALDRRLVADVGGDRDALDAHAPQSCRRPPGPHSSCRSSTATSAPSRANASAMASPMPRAPPVTSAVLSVQPSSHVVPSSASACDPADPVARPAENPLRLAHERHRRSRTAGTSRGHVLVPEAVDEVAGAEASRPAASRCGSARSRTGSGDARKQPFGRLIGLGISPLRLTLRLHLQMRMGQQDGGQQADGIGMARPANTVAASPCSTIMPRYITATRWLMKRTVRQIVRDEQVGCAAARPGSSAAVDDLGARRRVERRGRLVEDDELRMGHHGAGDADALLLPGGSSDG